jgi:hypothetical protein
MMNPPSSPFFFCRLDAERVAAKLTHAGARCTSPIRRIAAAARAGTDLRSRIECLSWSSDVIGAFDARHHARCNHAGESGGGSVAVERVGQIGGDGSLEFGRWGHAGATSPTEPRRTNPVPYPSESSRLQAILSSTEPCREARRLLLIPRSLVRVQHGPCDLQG